MSTRNRILPAALAVPAAVLAAVLLTACSSVAQRLPDKKVEYRKATSLPPLEVPPDLASPTTRDDMAIPGEGATTFSAYQGREERASPGAQAAVLPEPEGIRLARDGDTRWLVVQAEPDALWPKLREFWLQEGLLIAQEDPRAGILETDWAENRADIKEGPIRNVLGKVMDFAYSAATRDKFRMRLERGARPGTTEVYISHRGVEEVVKGEDQVIWQPRDPDPELEAVMLSRLMVFLGTEREKAERALAAREAAAQAQALMVRDAQGFAALELAETFSRAWRRVGLALDRVGFTVQDRDRSAGVYYVRYNDPLKEQQGQGILDKLKFWGGDEPPSEDLYQVAVSKREGGGSRVVVLDRDGERDASPTAQRILNLLQEQLQ
jgi:outer membrane protein assembly factor BamC